jgi:predicted DNA-binding transcriptional regulator YafY
MTIQELDHYVLPLDYEMPMVFLYRNHRGETAERRVIPMSVEFCATEWHPEPQWILGALDLDRGVTRQFAMRDMKEVRIIEDAARRGEADGG